MAAPYFDIESHSVTATLYLHRALTVGDIPDLRIACAVLPMHVRHLRIDARALRDADGHTREVLRDIVRYWRRTRSGGLALCATERLLGMAPTTPVPIVPAATLRWPPSRAKGRATG